MSMSYELMMRKKEQIMYATIKGSLIDTDGVISGFAYNNYLATQEEFDCSKDFEITIKVNTGNQSVTQFKVFCRNNFGANASTSIGFAIGIENGKIKAFFRNSNGVVIGSQTGNNGITTFANNVDCFFRLSQKKYNNTYTIQIESSLDNVNWVKEVNLTSSLPLRNSGQGIAFGGGSFSNTSQYWAGSIDLPNSYIKLGSTKYNLQAVVGYTIVGSPTIVDGVVSGFSSSDYLTLPEPTILNQDFELKTSFICDSISANMRIIVNVGTNFSGLNFVSNIQKLRFGFYNGETRRTVDTLNNITSNIRYYFICYRKNNILGIKVSTDNINWEENETEILATDNMYFVNGIRIGWAGTGVFNGSLYISETQIKIGNKLWFNGQQA